MNFNEIVQQAIAANVELRASRPEFQHRFYHPEHYAKECCTVHINIGRGVGKTEYIIKHARPWDAVVVHNETMRREMMRRSIQCEVFTAGELERESLGAIRSLRYNKPPRTVYVDEPRGCGCRALDFAYRLFAGHPDQTFLFLGE